MCFIGQATDLTWPEPIWYNRSKQPVSLENPSKATGCLLLYSGQYWCSLLLTWNRFLLTQPESIQCFHGIKWFNCYCPLSQDPYIWIREPERHESRPCRHFQVGGYILHPPLSSQIEPYDAPGAQRAAEEVQWVSQTGVFCCGKITGSSAGVRSLPTSGQYVLTFFP